MAACNNTNENFRQHQDASARFRHALDSSRLGRRHDTLESYTASVGCGSKNKDDHPKDFSLVTILCRKKGVKTNNTSSLSILIGRKRRGFGAGLYNCFGGKLEKDLGEQKHPAKGAVREVLEETGVSIPLSTMEESKVGTINFTFDDWQDHSAMRVHLFCVFVSLSEDATCSTPNQTQNASTVTIHPDQIRGCDEIEPCWVHDCYDLPLHQMFADDSIWLPMLLHHHEASTGESNMRFDAWFHFHKGGAETNSIMHYYISIQNETASEQSAAKYNLEKKLFHALHDNHIHNPSIKEFKESWSFANSVRSFLKEEKRMKYVLDVAGGHGALAAMFLLLVSECEYATVIDPAIIKGKVGVNDAWSEYWGDKRLSYRHECLRTGLRTELDNILREQNVSPSNVLVVACHACQHLTDETLEIASEYGVNVAVMPCCQKDHKGTWKGLSKQLANSSANNSNNSRKAASLSFGTIMDLLAAGKMMAWNTGLKANVEYAVKMKLMDSSITPQHNRIIMCKSIERRDENCNDEEREAAHQRLARAYRRAHFLNKVEKNISHGWKNTFRESLESFLPSLLTGFCIGLACSHMILRRKG